MIRLATMCRQPGILALALFLGTAMAAPIMNNMFPLPAPDAFVCFGPCSWICPAGATCSGKFTITASSNPITLQCGDAGPANCTDLQLIVALASAATVEAMSGSTMRNVTFGFGHVDELDVRMTGGGQLLNSRIAVTRSLATLSCETPDSCRDTELLIIDSSITITASAAGAFAESRLGCVQDSSCLLLASAANAMEGLELLVESTSNATVLVAPNAVHALRAAQVECNGTCSLGCGNRNGACTGMELDCQDAACCGLFNCDSTADCLLASAVGAAFDQACPATPPVDECQATPSPCHPDADCERTIDGVACTCAPGFVGDGLSCVADLCGQLPPCNRREIVEQFDVNKLPTGWNSQMVDRCWPLPPMIGGLKANAALTLSKTFAELPPHSSVSIQVHVVLIDSWDLSDALNVTVDGMYGARTDPSTTFLEGFDLCGDERYMEPGLQVVSVPEMAHSGPTLDLAVVPSLDDFDEHWGIAKIAITLDPSSPSSACNKCDKDNMVCINGPGAYTCGCEDGYYLFEAECAPLTCETHGMLLQLRQPKHRPLSEWVDARTGAGIRRYFNCSGQTVLGGAGRLGRGARPQRHLRNLPSHSVLDVSVTIFAIDTWENETISLFVDGAMVASATVDFRLAVNNSCGRSDPDYGLVVLRADVPHLRGDVVLHLETDLDQDAEDESYGISSAQIVLKSKPCPEPFVHDPDVCLNIVVPVVLNSTEAWNAFAAAGCVKVPGGVEVRNLDFNAPARDGSPALLPLGLEEVEGYLAVEGCTEFDLETVMPNLTAVLTEGTPLYQDRFGVSLTDNTGIATPSGWLNTLRPHMPVRWTGNTGQCVGRREWMLLPDSLVQEPGATCACRMHDLPNSSLCSSQCLDPAAPCAGQAVCRGGRVASTAGFEQFEGCHVVVGDVWLQGLDGVPDFELDVLAGLVRIEGGLIVSDTTGVEAFDFLPQLEVVRRLIAINNNGLVSSQFPTGAVSLAPGVVTSQGNPKLCAGFGDAGRSLGDCNADAQFDLHLVLNGMDSVLATISTAAWHASIDALVLAALPGSPSSEIDIEPARPGVGWELRYQVTARIADSRAVRAAFNAVQGAVLAEVEARSGVRLAVTPAVKVPFDRTLVAPVVGGGPLALAGASQLVPVTQSGSVLFETQPTLDTGSADVLLLFEYRPQSPERTFAFPSLRIRRGLDDEGNSSTGTAHMGSQNAEAASLEVHPWQSVLVGVPEHRLPVCRSTQPSPDCLSHAFDYEARLRVVHKANGTELLRLTADLPFLHPLRASVTTSADFDAFVVHFLSGALPEEHHFVVWESSQRGDAWKPHAPRSLESRAFRATDVELSHLADGLIEARLHAPFSSQALGSVSAILPYTHYAVRIVSSSPGGRQQTVVLTTPEAAPGPVRNISLEGTRSTSVDATVQLPEVPNGRVMALHIKVMQGERVASSAVIEVDLSAEFQGRFPDQLIRLTLGNLEPCSQYRLAVCAATSAGLGPSAESAPFTTPSARPQRPRAPRLEVLPDGLVHLTWQPPPQQPNKRCSCSYELWGAAANGTVLTMLYAGELTNIGIETSMPTQFRLRAIGDEGPSEFSRPTTALAPASSAPQSGQSRRTLLVPLLLSCIALALVLAFLAFAFHRNGTAYDSKWELARRDVIVVPQVLGKGAFSTVFLGERHCDGHTQLVAIKQLDGTKPAAVEAFLRELELLKDLTARRPHRNILRLKGTCVIDTPHLAVLEYAAQGSLKALLHSSRAAHFCVPTTQLLRYAHDIASGLVHLKGCNIVHRDIAARNCLVFGDDRVKIADFGLARTLDEGTFVCSKEDDAYLPYRWMAVEAITNRVFSPASDVWSFGVCLWEIMTLAQTPYALCKTEDLQYHIIDGFQLSHPMGCPNGVYRVMQSCWEYDTSARGTIRSMAESLRDLNDRIVLGDTSPDLLCDVAADYAGHNEYDVHVLVQPHAGPKAKAGGYLMLV